MEAHMERVKAELAELDGRLQKLRAFVQGRHEYDQLGQAEKVRLIRQLNIMELYADVLEERLRAAAEPGPHSENLRLQHDLNEAHEKLADAYIQLSGRREHASDCATSCAPARCPGPCDCMVAAGGPVPRAHSVHCPAFLTVTMEAEGMIPGACTCGASTAAP